MPKFIQVNLTSEIDSDISDVAKYTLLDPNTNKPYTKLSKEEIESLI